MKTIGRPSVQEKPKIVNFRADARAQKAIEDLVNALDVPGTSSGGVRSFAIRKALIEAAERLGDRRTS